jgi:hypothetical protein
VRAADFYSFVTQTSDASTISLLNSSTGAQLAGRPLGLDTEAGAVYSANGATAFVIQTLDSGANTTVAGFSLSSGKIAGSVSLPVTSIVSIAASPTTNAVFAAVSNGASAPGAIYEIDTSTFVATMVFQSAIAPTAIAVSASGGTIFLATATAVLSISTNNFQLTTTTSVPGVTRIAPARDGKRLYLSTNVAPPALSTVIALDLTTNTIVGSVPASPSAYVAVSPDGSKFYTTFPAAGLPGALLLELVSTTTLAIGNSVLIASSTSTTNGPPLAINAAGTTLAVVSSGGSTNVTLATAPLLKLSTPVPVGNACGLAFPSASYVAVTNCGADTADVVDVTTKTVSGRLDAGPSPQATLVGSNGSVLFVSNTHGVWALAVKNGSILSKVAFPIAAPVTSAQLALSADGQTLFASYGTGVLEIATATNLATGSVPGIPSGFTVSAIATSGDGNYLFVAGVAADNPQDFQLLLLDPSTGALLQTVAAGSKGLILLPSADSSTVYFEGINSQGNYSLSAFNVKQSKFILLPPTLAGGLAQTANGSVLFVAQTAAGAIDAINTTTLATTVITSPVPPVNVAITPDGNELVVTSTAPSLGVITISKPTGSATVAIGGATLGIDVR